MCNNAYLTKAQTELEKEENISSYVPLHEAQKRILAFTAVAKCRKTKQEQGEGENIPEKRSKYHYLQTI